MNLIERLRKNWEDWGSPCNRDICVNEECMAIDCSDAADRIMALEKALHDIAGGHVPHTFSFDPDGFHERIWVWGQQVARAALEVK